MRRDLPFTIVPGVRLSRHLGQRQFPVAAQQPSLLARVWAWFTAPAW